jgi:hypothetical protein
VKSHFRTIPVLDGNGDQLSLFEFLEPGSLFGLVRRRRYHLCTGELVTKEGGGFIIVSTGEYLKRIVKGAEGR